MRNKVLVTLAGFLFLCLPTPITAQRIIENWNFGWRFHRGEIDENQLASPDTSGWEVIDVPHDFQISQPWVKPDKSEKMVHLDGASFKTRLSARGFKEMGEGWYVKTYIPAPELKGKRILIDFEGIMYVGDVYLNGERVGGTDYGYLGFEIDLSDKLQYGKPNVIAVRASTSGPVNSRWYTGGGLYRDVRLIVTDAGMYLSRHPIYVTTKDNKFVNLQIEVVYRPGEKSVTLETVIKNAQGNVIYRKTKECPFYSPIEAHDLGRIPSNEIVWEQIALDNPRLWSCEDPYLYTVEVTLYDKKGKAVDMATQRFGVRSIEISPQYGLKLNGKKVLLKGNANHHTLGALGAAAYPRAIEKRLKLLKAFGFNHIRTSHNPYSVSFLDLCDSLGILVVDEIYDKWLDQFAGGRKPWMQLWTYDVPEWIKRDRNHPSVVMWSLGNEQQTFTSLPFGDWGVTCYRMMKELINRYDSTRKLTVAMHPRGRTIEVDGKLVTGLRPKGQRPEVDLPSPLAMESDVASYNYSYDYFKTDGRRYPDMVFYQSEANTASMGKNFYEMDLDKVIGLAYWGQIDYLGESAGWPAKGWNKGTFDISLQPKPQAYLARSIFKPEEPVVRIAIVDRKADNLEWNSVRISTDGLSEHWNRIAGKRYDIKVFTNADKAELVVNGKTIDTKANPVKASEHNTITFKDVEFQPGYIEARAYKDGRRVATHQIETAGEASTLILEADTEKWMADGQDLQHIRVTAVDKKGRRVPSAQAELTFSVEGDAGIVAVDNGNLSSDEMMTGNRRRLYNGSALVILRAGRKAGRVVLTVNADNFKAKRITLNTF